MNISVEPGDWDSHDELLQELDITAEEAWMGGVQIVHGGSKHEFVSQAPLGCFLPNLAAAYGAGGAVSFPHPIDTRRFAP